MTRLRASLFAVFAFVCVGLPLASVQAQKQEAPKVDIPQPGVPQVMTMEGKFVRAAYNNEGYVILGYQASNRSIGEPWMLLEVGMTLRDKVPDYTMKRDAFSLEIPSGQTLPLPSITEFRNGDTAALQNRAKIQRDSIDYFPPNAHQACAMVFFPDLANRPLPRDDVDMTDQRACIGRLYFNIPGGIAYGQHWLNVKFAKSVLRIPFRILTADEEKMLSKNYKSIDKQIKEAFAPPKKK